MSRKAARQRYWLRSFSGWPWVNQAQPCAAHHALATLEGLGHIKLLVTQNVDRLHQKAGSRAVVDLHGRLDEVVCMSCGELYARGSIQTDLSYLAPLIASAEDPDLRPDGDADIQEQHIDQVVPPACGHCGGILKPNVVFFGDNVDRNIVNNIYDSIKQADAMLIAGTSLQVFSGFRFCRFAADNGVPIASINPGQTRGDALIETRISCRADDILPEVVNALT